MRSHIESYKLVCTVMHQSLTISPTISLQGQEISYLILPYERELAFTGKADILRMIEIHPYFRAIGQLFYGSKILVTADIDWEVIGENKIITEIKNIELNVEVDRLLVDGDPRKRF